jgi:lysophospholipase L1-like esterase
MQWWLLVMAAVLRTAGGIQHRAATTDSCAETTLPRAPDYDHGRFSSESWYDISKLGGYLPRDYETLVPLMLKLKAGKTVNIAVFGGSETSGTGCNQQPYILKECAWPVRVGQWLEAAFPGSHVNIVNKAQGGSTSNVILAGLGVVLRGHDVAETDLIMLDTLVNDAQEVPGTSSLSQGDAISGGYEKLIRSAHEILPTVPIFCLIAGCPMCHEMKRSQMVVIEHYKLPYVDFSAMVQATPSLWDVDGPHPGFKSHQAMADAIATVFADSWRLGCDHPSPFVLADAALSSPSVLEQFAFCSTPSSFFSVFGAAGAPEPAMTGDFEMREDVPGKPGWIAEKPGSTVVFPLRFGNAPRLSVTWLRSYEGMGTARIGFGTSKFGKRLEFYLDGLWPEDFTDKVSQSFTQSFQADGVGMQQSFNGDAGMLGFALPPQYEGNLTIEVLANDNEFPGRHRSHTGTKIKILEVSAC